MKKKQQKIELIQREGCGEFNKWEQKKVSMSCQIELITWIFFKPSHFFSGALKNW